VLQIKSTMMQAKYTLDSGPGICLRTIAVAHYYAIITIWHSFYSNECMCNLS